MTKEQVSHALDKEAVQIKALAAAVGKALDAT